MDNDLDLALGSLVDCYSLLEVIECLADVANDRDEFGVGRELEELAVMIANLPEGFDDAPARSSFGD